ncbi:outer membrane protein assembly factor BamC [Roseateles koreensis]|uniref:outer membrane protein assembly factor BamC n=1 Tax=Roseateles koreensis TaxID=2987526 RepID=UPI0039648415
MTRSSNVPLQHPTLRLTSLILVSALAAAGCSSIDKVISSDKVDYRSGAKQTTGLDVPPDLTQLARDNRNPASGGVVSAAALQQSAAGKAASASMAPAANNTVALNAAGNIRLERDGNVRWLHTDLSPEQLWQPVKDFWTERGFELTTEQADVGLMETNWNENRAKLPQDIIRSTIGKVFDNLYSSGERDMFRTRVERNAKGGTDIYISHKGVQEVYTNQQKESTAWQARPSDPLLESEMLSRLMLKLGAKDEAAKAALVAASAPVAQVAAAGVDAPKNRSLADVPDELQVAEGFERAWRRVGQSLDRHGFTVEDRDRKQGLFFLRYADPNQAGKDEPNFFQRLFSKDEGGAAKVRYRVAVKSEGERSTVSVLDDKGQKQTNEIAKRILNLLMDDLR